MAHDAAALGIAVDPIALYREADPDALLLLGWTIERVSKTKAEENRRQKAEAERAQRAGARGK